MPDRASAHVEHADDHQGAERYDLVVVGCGIAGLNALYAATQYLGRDARVLLIDQKRAPGGMWNVAYDFVRLHQPHSMFTVGDLKWKWNKPPEHLATRDEVQHHLVRSLDRIKQAFDLETCFEHTMSTCEEIQTKLGPRAKLTLYPNDDAAQIRTVISKRAIHAQGMDYQPSQPLAVASKAVFSIVPQHLRASLAANPDATVYVVGGGKSGMDVILEALDDRPARKIVLISGPGTSFFNRDQIFPGRMKRWITGLPISHIGRDLGTRFDGDNEDAVMAHFRHHYSTDPRAPDRAFQFATQSLDERARITAGLSQHYRDYLVDVTDGTDGPVMALRGGDVAPVERGSIFVNCTGSILRGGAHDAWRPCLSAGDTVLRINMRDSYHLLPSVSGFFLVHLLYRGLLRGTGHYTMDSEALFSRNRGAWVGATNAQMYMHRVLGIEVLPLKLLEGCALDFDRWYPLPRRLVSLIDLKMRAASDVARCRAALDRVADRFGIHCAPLD